MITPSFNLTATERVLPKLALDFTTASLDPRVTFTRTTDATHPATYINSAGYITSAINNQPRFDYDPITLICKGLLIEESRTNLQTYSVGSGTGWAVLSATLNSTTIQAPDNTNTAFQITTTANSGFRYGPSFTSVTSAMSSSFFAKYISGGSAEVIYQAVGNAAWGGSGDAATITFNASTGAFVSKSSRISSYSIEASGLNFWRVTVTYTPTSAAAVASYLGSTVSGTVIQGWGFQTEVGAFATSYIPTTTTALTRNADVATMTGTNFSDWFNASEGTLSCWFNSFIPSGTVKGVISVGSSSTNYIDIRTGSTLSSVMVTSGAQQTGLSNVSYSSNTNYKSVTAYKLNNCIAASNATLSSLDTVATLPTCDTLYIGSTATVIPSSGYFQKVFYWPQRLTNNEVQAFSK